MNLSNTQVKVNIILVIEFNNNKSSLTRLFKEIKAQILISSE